MDRKWDVYLPNKELDLDSILHIFQNNYLEQMPAPFAPILMNTGYFEDSPRLTAPIVLENDLVGYVSMLCKDKDCGDEEKKELQIIADAVAIYLRGYEGEKFDRITLRQILSGKLIFGKLQEGEELNRWKEFYDIPADPPYTILLVKSNNTSSFLYSQINALGLPLMSHQKDGVIYILACMVKDENTLRDYIRRIQECAWGIRISIGVSKAFNELHSVDVCRRQAEKACELGEKLDCDTSVYYYQNMILSAVFESTVNSLGLENCIHPGIHTLTSYDQAHGTDYTETLRTFLYEAGEHAKICSILHIHRNTLNYRLQKIFSLIGADRKDPAALFHLYMSFRILDDSNMIDDGREGRNHNAGI